jgi:cell division protein FtsW (lipid II flippase)
MWMPFRLVLFGQGLFITAYVFALWWHRPAAVEPVRAIAIGGVISLVTAVLLAVAMARRQPAFAALVATVQMLVMIGFALRMRLGVADLSSVVLYVFGVLAAVAMYQVGQGLCQGDGYSRRRSRVILTIAALAFGSGFLLLFFSTEAADGAKVSVSAAGQTLQPAEILRVCIIGFAAFHLGSREPLFRAVGPMPTPLRRLVMLYAVVPAAVALALLAVVSDLGPAALLVCGIVGTVVYVTRKWYHAVVSIALFVPLAYVMTKLLDIRKVYERFALRADPFHGDCIDPDACYSLAQPGKALLGYARGGFFGTGPGLGRPESIGWQSRNDYILAVAGEELGFLGILMIIALYALLVVQLFRMATRAALPWAKAWAVGLVVMLTANIALPVLGATAVFPVIGVTTPLLSAGGTSMIVTLAVIGLIAGIGRTEVSAREAAAGRRERRHYRVPRQPLPPRPGERWDRRLAPGLAGVLVVVACVAFADAQIASAAGRLDRYDPGGDIATHSRVTLNRGSILASDGSTVVETRTTDGRSRRLYPDGDLYGEAAGYLLPLLGTGANLEYGLAEWTECGPERGTVVESVFGRRCEAADVWLTLEPTLQKAAARALGEKRGAVVAIDPRSGAVRALVSYPRVDYGNIFDGENSDGAVISAINRARANDKTRSDRDRTRGVDGADVGAGLRGHATDITLNPGSSFKPVVATAVPDGKLAGFSAPVTDSIPLSRQGGRLHNAGIDQGGGVCGGNIVDGFRKSCNTLFAILARDVVGEPRLRRTAAGFGFETAGEGGTYTEADKVRLQVSRVDPQASKTDTGECDIELMAIGQQCVHATPVQMALVAATLANGGVRPEPYFVDRVARGEDVLYRHRAPAAPAPLLSKQNLALIRQGMIAVTQPGGTAVSLGIPGIEVAAKTGTAQDHPGTPGLETAHAWAIAYATPTPGAGASGTGEPIAICVLVEGKPGDTSLQGGRDAGPIARQVITAAFGRR